MIANIIDLGKIIDVLYKDLQRLRKATQGRRKTESDLRQSHPDLELWREIDASESLSTLARKQFFATRLDTYTARPLMQFIGKIIALEYEAAQKTWKKFRRATGQQLKRTPRKSQSASSS